jgi:hypothetical protein
MAPLLLAMAQLAYRAYRANALFIKSFEIKFYIKM